MKYFWDYIILLLSIAGSIASIVGYFNQEITIEATISICFFGTILLFSMFHDWYYTMSPLEKVPNHIFCLCNLLTINGTFS